MSDVSHETRVKNALLQVVSSNGSEAVSLLENTESKQTPSKKKKKDDRTVFVKNRFLHARPVLISQNAGNVLSKEVIGTNVQKNGNLQPKGNKRVNIQKNPENLLCKNITGTETSIVSLPTNTNKTNIPHTISAGKKDNIKIEDFTPTVFTSTVSLNTSVLTNNSCSPSVQFCLSNVSKSQDDKQTGTLTINTVLNCSKAICPYCKTLNGQQDIKNVLKCLRCEKVFPIQLIDSTDNSFQSAKNSFCGDKSVNESILTSVPGNLVPGDLAINENKRRSNSTKVVRPYKKIKPAETIDLVSSDDEHCVASDEMKSTSVVSEQKVHHGSCFEKPTLIYPIVVQPTQLPNEYKFDCNKAMFGELYGRAISPTNIVKSRIYLSLECSINRETTVTEKYTLSVGQKDVQRVLVYFGRVPSIVAIETAERFSEVACQRIGKDVLVPNSDNLQKRFIVLALAFAFKNECDAIKEVHQFSQCILPWTKLTILSHADACFFVEKLKFDVCQKEIVYSPVQTVLVYPLPTKTIGSGGIPITNEDLLCLQDGTYLNDIIIDFYLKYIFDNILTSQQKERTYIFNSYFYKRLTQKQSPKPNPVQMHDQVKKWTRNVDIFEKDFVVIPINEHSHWFLAIICFPGSTKNDIFSDEVAGEEDSDEDSKEVSESPCQANMTVNDSTNFIMNKPQNELINTNAPLEVNKRLVSYDSSPEPSPANLNELNISSKSLQENTFTQPEVAAIKEQTRYKQANDYEETYVRPCILLFDSLTGGGHSSVFTNLRNYISMEWINRKTSKVLKTFDKVTMSGSYPIIPRQNNDCDCGIFLLQYVESFFKLPITNFKFPIHLEHWFTLEIVANKRKEIRQIITQLSEQYNTISTS
uniref:Sentrin-specific protease 7 n=1 Tax=Hydra vulgaris TaxID=6087 RepID=T2M6I8_HYDVU